MDIILVLILKVLKFTHYFILYIGYLYTNFILDRNVTDFFSSNYHCLENYSFIEKILKSEFILKNEEVFYLYNGI